MTIPLVAPTQAQPEDYASVRDWLVGWGREIAAVRFDAARLRFAPDLTAFGTHADVVHGRDAVVERQWRQVWPTIEGFRFVLSELEVMVSPDRLLAVAIVPWTSVGIAADGSRFDRPGRATVVLTRTARNEPWFGRHTHFSLARGVPQRSHGARPPASG